MNPFIFYFSSDGEEDGSYRRRSRIPPSVSFSYDKDYHHKHRNGSSSSKDLGDDAISKALNQISNHLSHTGLREGDFLDGSLSPRSPCTMVVKTL